MSYTGQKKREYDKVWVATRRKLWLSDKMCVVCGTKEKLELHHKVPADKVSHRIWSWSKERRSAELYKCEVRCHEHHRDVTGRAQHGTASKYGRGCRCRPCKDAHALAFRLRYRNKKLQGLLKVGKQTLNL